MELGAPLPQRLPGSMSIAFNSHVGFPWLAWRICRGRTLSPTPVTRLSIGIRRMITGWSNCIWKDVSLWLCRIEPGLGIERSSALARYRAYKCVAGPSATTNRDAELKPGCKVHSTRVDSYSDHQDYSTCYRYPL